MVELNPFLDKSPADLLAMVPGLSDGWLDALATVVLGGKWGDAFCCEDGEPIELTHDCIGILGPGTRCRSIVHYTSDWREAGRLLVKYHLQTGEIGGDEQWWVAHNLYWVGEGQEDPLATHQDPCRAIALAAVTCELTRMIEGDGE